MSSGVFGSRTGGDVRFGGLTAFGIIAARSCGVVEDAVLGGGHASHRRATYATGLCDLRHSPGCVVRVSVDKVDYGIERGRQ